MTATVTPKIGDKVLVDDRYASNPPATIIRITPKGWLRVNVQYPGGAKEMTFKPSEYQDGQYVEVGGNHYNKYNRTKVYLATPEKVAEFNAHIAQLEADKKERQEQQDKERQEREEQAARELAEVKAVCDNVLPTVKQGAQAGDICLCRHVRIQPDGSRMYLLDLPVKPEYQERKKSFQMVWARCKDDEDYDWKTSEKKKVVKADFTWTTGSGSGFSSSYGTYANDEEALWDVVSNLYHRW